MKKYSMLKVLIRHPLKTFGFWLIYLVVLVAVLPYNVSARMPDTTPGSIIIYGIPLLLALFTLKGHYNHRIRKYAKKGMVPPKEKTLFGFLWNTTKKSYAASCRRQSALEGALTGVYDDLVRSSRAADAQYQIERRAREREMDQRARKRWDAVNNQKKAEWDARDAAKRGKDLAARDYCYQAAYWKKQSKKY